MLRHAINSITTGICVAISFYMYGLVKGSGAFTLFIKLFWSFDGVMNIL